MAHGLVSVQWPAPAQFLIAIEK